jgi:hypothetical protein
VWQKLCQEIGADFIEGGTWDGDRVQASHGQWTITLDLYHVHSGRVPLVFTRFRAPYVNPDQFFFSVTKRSLFSGLAKLLGMQDVEVGYAEFDRDFIIKGNDELKLKALFASERLRQLLSAQPDVHFSIESDDGLAGSDYPPQTDALCFVADGLISDVARLKSLFDLFAVTLDQLCLIGSAYEGEVPTKNC